MEYIKILLILFFIYFNIEPILSLSNVRDDGTLIQTTNGFIQGFIDQKVRQFLGIPYAQPPVGDLRWVSPQPISWNNVLNATQYKQSCPQECQLPQVLCPTKTSEDCLYMNVFAPLVGQFSTLRPVMVYSFMVEPTFKALPSRPCILQLF
jgi:hypothetical protein